MLRLVTFSTLYPNAAQPTHGVFVEQRLRHMLATGRVAASVVAPVPWFPSRASWLGRYAEFAAAPARETRHGVDVSHPRYAVIPKLGMALAPRLLAWGAERAIKAAWTQSRAQLLDAHYLYPDGVAAAAIARRRGWPYVLTARGSDVNRIGDFDGPCRRMIDAVENSLVTFTVSAALRERLIALGARSEKVLVARNGVDLDAFRPGDRTALRRKWAVDGFVILSVGKLDENKGHHVVIEALESLTGATLLIAGTGPWRQRLAALAARRGLSDQVRLLGTVAHEQIAELYSLADVVTLMSSREGLPNVVLEALACGCPVIATRAGGVAEVLMADGGGQLLGDRSTAALVTALWKVRATPPQRDQVRLHAESMGWSRLATQLVDALEAAASGVGIQLDHTPGEVRTL
jgi:glycosyltransferase involved in cell wall biosynthesis